MVDKGKIDGNMGLKVHEYLLEKGVETPYSKEMSLDSNDKKQQIQQHFNEIMVLLGLDLSDDSLKETPKRVARMFVDEIYWGLDYNNFPKITTIENKMSYDEMIIEKNIKCLSNCEHHFVPILGTAAIAYIPNKKVIGLSKLNRIVEYFCRRPQVQERLTEQIFHALEYILETSNISVIIEAQHTCVITRGVEDLNSRTVTSKIGGLFKTNNDVRAEFYNLLKLQG